MVAIYVRESSEGQRDNYRHDKQLSEGLKFAESQGDAYKVYDEVKSGKDGSVRPKWEELKRDINAGNIDTLFFWEYRRLGRDNEENEAIKKLLLKHNVRFYDAKAGWRDLKNHGVQLLTTIEGKQAEIDNQSRKEATIDGLHQQFDVGERRYSGRLYGYYAIATAGKKKGLDHISRTWHIQEDEAVLIRHVFSLAIEEKLGLSAICRRLAREHYKNREGKPWSHDKIRLMLRHPQYAGMTTTSDGTPRDSKVYDAIVPVEQWKLMQARYPEYITSKRKGRPDERFGSGILECVRCGSRYSHWDGWGQHRKKDGTVSRYPKINYAHNARTGCGGQVHYIAEVVEFILKDAFYSAIFHSEEILNRLKGDTDFSAEAEELDRLKGLLDANKKDCGNLLYLRKKGVSLDALAEQLKENEAEGSAIKASIETLETKIRDANLVYANAREVFSTKLNEEFQAAEEKEQNRLIKQVISRVWVDRTSFDVEFIDGSKRHYDYAECRDTIRRSKEVPSKPSRKRLPSSREDKIKIWNSIKKTSEHFSSSASRRV